MPEHLLLALIDDCLKKPTESEIVLQAFKQLNVKLFDLIEDIEASFDHTQTFAVEGKIPLSKKVEMILKLSFLEAKTLRSHTINAEHVFLSYLRGQTAFCENKLTPKYGLTYDKAKDCIKGIVW